MPGNATRFTRTVDTAERDAQAARLRAAGMQYAQIGQEVGLSTSAAHAAVQRAIAAAPREAGAELLALELERLDTLWRTALGVMARQHVKVADGRVVKDQDGNVILDDEPKLKAIDRLLKIQERRSKYLGLDAPVKVDARVTDGLDAQLQAVAAELAALEAGEFADAYGEGLAELEAGPEHGAEQAVEQGGQG